MRESVGGVQKEASNLFLEGKLGPIQNGDAGDSNSLSTFDLLEGVVAGLTIDRCCLERGL